MKKITAHALNRKKNIAKLLLQFCKEIIRSSLNAIIVSALNARKNIVFWMEQSKFINSCWNEWSEDSENLDNFETNDLLQVFGLLAKEENKDFNFSLSTCVN